MNILCLCGSTRYGSGNQQLLHYIDRSNANQNFQHLDIADLPMFHPDLDKNPISSRVGDFRKAAANAGAIIICTPEYLHNIPAVLKNALEWLTTSGELKDKKVLPITYTPHAPRGEKAMQSLLWTLKALDARILTSLELYHQDISFDKDGKIVDENSDGKQILMEAIQLLI